MTNLPTKIPSVMYRWITVCEKDANRTPTKVIALPTMAIFREPYLVHKAPAKGPAKIRTDYMRVR